MKRKEISRTIDKMVQRIVDRFDPERVILFGSYARETAGPDSDVDLLIVMPVSGSKRERQLEIRLALREFRIFQRHCRYNPGRVHTATENSRHDRATGGT